MAADGMGPDDYGAVMDHTGTGKTLVLQEGGYFIDQSAHLKMLPLELFADTNISIL